MSSLIQEATIIIRQDSSGNWTASNPTPSQGEWCLETDTGNIKIGDGSTAWTSLGYSAGKKITDLTVTDSATFTPKIQANGGITVPVLHVQDQKASGTPGGTFTSGAWRTRVLNTSLTNTIIGASLSSNQITLPAGTYKINAWATAYSVGRHQTRLYNVTDASVIQVGSGKYAIQIYGVNNDSRISKVVTFTVTTLIELQHQCDTTAVDQGFGVDIGFTLTNELFADVFIEKLA